MKMSGYKNICGETEETGISVLKETVNLMYSAYLS